MNSSRFPNQEILDLESAPVRTVQHCVHACKGGKGEKAKSQSQGEIEWKQYCDEVAMPLVLADVGM